MKTMSQEASITADDFNTTNEPDLRRMGSKPIAQIVPNKQASDWSLFNVLGCCSGDSSTGKLDPHDKKLAIQLKDSTARAISHYQISEANPFLAECQKNTNDPYRDLPLIRGLSHRKFYSPKNPYPQENLFLLGCDSWKVICKLETIALQSSTKVSQARADSINTSGLKSPEESKKATTLQKELMIEPVADYIAQLHSGILIVDGLCGNGVNAIQFARHCASLIAIEANTQKISEARNNAKSQDIDNKIDFVQTDFLRMKKLKADVVFLTPTQLKQQPNEKFSVFLHIREDLQQIIEHALAIAPNVCIRLPCDTNPEEIGAIFARIYNGNPKLESSHKFTLKIQQFEVNDVPDCIVVYFGAFNNIKENEIKDLLFDLATQCHDPVLKTEYPETLVGTLIRRLGAQFIVETILNFQVESKNSEENKSLLKFLFDRAIGIDIIFARLRSELRQNPELVSIFESNGCAVDFAQLYSTNTGRDSVLTNRLSHKAHFAHTHSIDDLGPKITDRSSQKKKSHKNFNLHLKDLCMSTESDFALSSYSLRSGAMPDSGSGSPRSRRAPSYDERDLAGLTINHPHMNNNLHTKTHIRTRSTGSSLLLIREEVSTPTSERGDSIRIKRNESTKTLN